MAVVTRYVNRASTAGGDGTTNATAGANRAYATLSAWEAATQQNLVTGGNTAIVICEGTTADTTRVTIDGWTTGAANDITIRTDTTAPAGRHPGLFSTNHYRIAQTTGGPEGGLNLIEDYITVIGLQVFGNNTDRNGGILCRGGSYGVANKILISHCIAKIRNTSATRTTCIGTEVDDGHDNLILRIYNCVVYDAIGGASDVGFNFSAFAGTYSVYNCTAQNCATGYRRQNGTCIPKNCIAEDCTDGWNGTFTTAVNNQSDIASDAPGTSTQTGNVAFVDAANDDFHLSAADTVAKNNGVSLAAEAIQPFSDGIDTQTRTSWSIGADEPISASTVNVDMWFRQQPHTSQTREVSSYQ
jgi:hypothetical protein